MVREDCSDCSSGLPSGNPRTLVQEELRNLVDDGFLPLEGDEVIGAALVTHHWKEIIYYYQRCKVQFCMALDTKIEIYLMRVK